MDATALTPRACSGRLVPAQPRSWCRTSAGSSGATETPTTTIPLPSGTDALGTGTFQLFSQTDLNFQTLFGLGEAGLNSVAGEVLAVVAAANAAPGGASYQSVYDEFIAQANRLQESALEAQRAHHLVTARSRFIPRRQV